MADSKSGPAGREGKSPSAEQLGWLSVAPPTDDHGQLVAWTLADCRIEEAKWKQPIVHERLTLERVQLTALQWDRPTFRNCVLREVAFERSNLTHARFESVTFERCTFERTTFENGQFDHCRFVDCSITHGIAIRTALRFCELEGLTLTVLDMRECDLSGTVCKASSLQGPRISKSRADTLTITGGELRGVDLTACELRELLLDGVAVEGFRVIDCEVGRAELRGGRVEGLAWSGTRFARLAFVRCTELPGARLIDCTLGELVVDACPAVASLLLADSKLDALAVQSSVLYDAAFERVEVGRARFEQSELTGVFFQAGGWQTLALLEVALLDYVAVKGTRFDQLQLDRAKLDPSLDRRLEGDSYGDGSMTWGGARGS